MNGIDSLSLILIFDLIRQVTGPQKTSSSVRTRKTQGLFVWRPRVGLGALCPSPKDRPRSARAKRWRYGFNTAR